MLLKIKIMYTPPTYALLLHWGQAQKHAFHLDPPKMFYSYTWSEHKNKLDRFSIHQINAPSSSCHLSKVFVGTKIHPMPRHTSKPEGSTRWSWRSAWLKRRDYRSYALLPRRASQFDPAIDKERKFINNLRWNMLVCAQTVLSVPLREQTDGKITKQLIRTEIDCYGL